MSDVVNMADHARQGDVSLRRVEALPPGLVEAKRDDIGRIVLAYGEHSGHAHTIRDKHVLSWRATDSDEVDYVEVGGAGTAVLAHEYESGAMAEHQPVGLAPGVYQVIRQREYVARDIERRAVD